MNFKFSCFLFVCAISFLNAQKNPINTDKKERVITMDQSLYFQDQDESKPFLGKVTKVDNTKQQLLLYGFAPENNAPYDSSFTKEFNKMGADFYLIKLNRTKNNVFIISDWKSPSKFFSSISLTTIPFKIRPGNDELERITTSGLKNLVLNFDFFSYNRQYYYHSGKNLRLRIALGTFISPAVEEIDNLQDDPGLEATTSKELFISGGIAINIGINDIGFSFIPFGWDQATTSNGRNWDYNGRRWWGFGIGLSPKFLNPKD
ncbi:hypothetical protein J4E06_08505 [Muricauda sp. NFXS6]|uniref:hypothetical protein n=1 Tax=Allomuricauda sp. NFXS6 TaxID=2819094 RepID=UPI0032E02001